MTTNAPKRFGPNGPKPTKYKYSERLVVRNDLTLFNVEGKIDGEPCVACIHATDYDSAEDKALKEFRKCHPKARCIHITEYRLL